MTASAAALEALLRQLGTYDSETLRYQYAPDVPAVEALTKAIRRCDRPYRPTVEVLAGEYADLLRDAEELRAVRRLLAGPAVDLIARALFHAAEPVCVSPCEAADWDDERVAESDRAPWREQARALLDELGRISSTEPVGGQALNGGDRLSPPAPLDASVEPELERLRRLTGR